MARKCRRICKVEDSKSKKIVVQSKDGIKTKTKEKIRDDLGSGRIINTENTNKGNANNEILDIKALERSVLKSIIGQDLQVRQIITAIYRAIYFKSMKCNVLVIGNSGTGKTETIKQIARVLKF